MLRVFFLFAMTLSVPFRLSAQLQQSSFLLGSGFQVRVDNENILINVIPSGGNATRLEVPSRQHMRTLSVSPALGFAAGRHLLLGLGLYYANAKTELNPDKNEKILSSPLGGSMYNILLHELYKEQTLRPVVWAEYIARPTPSLGLGVQVSTGYEWVRQKANTFLRQDISGSSGTGFSVAQYESTFKQQAFQAHISPSIRYSFGRHVGLHLLLGGLNWRQPTQKALVLQDEQLASDWEIDFSPSRWTLGFYVNWGGKPE